MAEESDQGEAVIRHHQVQVNGIQMHVAEQGSGPPVLLLHGFPQLWSSWRHQMSALARRGFRALAPDLRGYGDTDAPPDPTSYTILHLVGDIVALLDAFQEPKALVVGHDWGALLAWHLSLFRPDRVRGLVALGVPFFPRTPSTKPSDTFVLLGDGFYINQFQGLGRAEKAFERYDAVEIMKKFLSITIPDLIAPLGMEIIDFLDTPTSLPSWQNEEDIHYHAKMFEKSGFTGPLNYYRMMDMNWELLAPWQGAKVLVPTKYIVGNKDLGFQSFGTKDYIEGETFKSYVPDLEIVVIDGHHFIQQERADQVTTEILSFFDNLAIKQV